MQPLALLTLIFSTMSTQSPSLLQRIQHSASIANIDLTILPFYDSAIQSILSLSTESTTNPTFPFHNATRIDTHTHPVPSWFRALEPQAAGRETPTWNVSSHLQFMSEHDITRSILCFSTPQANAFITEADESLRKKKTIALARLMNEFTAELCRVYPERFSWLAVTPLPYVAEAVREVEYALNTLGAVGVGILTNHEGMYPGDGAFDALWEWLQAKAEKSGREGREVVFIHPTEPLIRLEDGRLINSRPCKSPTHFLPLIIHEM